AAVLGFVMGNDLDDCRMMLRDALNEMIAAYQEDGTELPPAGSLIEPISVECKQAGLKPKY
ncbi:MAG: hypothetical protein O3A00_16940, partial [Planctomycetota bacterium]|nr:hypothetical protein [Planctomycetota bacterium]